MNNTMKSAKTVTATGKLARGLISDGLEVISELVNDPDFGSDNNGLEESLSKLVRQYGMTAVLEIIHDSACTAAETHELADVSDETDFSVVTARLNVFRRKIDGAIKVLR